MRTYKSIAYAYASSPHAETLGMGSTGAYFVEHTFMNIEGYQCRTDIAHNCEGFSAPDHPDLIALYHEYEGDPSPWFLKYGNKKALAAVRAAHFVNHMMAD